MDELIAQIQEKTGIGADKAKEIAGVVTAFLRDNLPDDMLERLGEVAAGAAEKAGDTAGAAEGAASAAASSVTERAKDAGGAVAGTAGDLYFKTKDSITGSDVD